jgi:small-conductance mechanosensitive channel
MATIGVLNSGNNGVQSLLEPVSGSTGENSAIALGPATSPVAEGIKVSLSGAGLTKAASSHGDNKDIEESGLPENIQQILKMIRRLQQQIAENVARMQAVMSDKRLSAEERRAKLGALQAAIGSLNGGLITANMSLSKAMTQSNLTPEQVLKTASLAMKP